MKLVKGRRALGRVPFPEESGEPEAPLRRHSEACAGASRGRAGRFFPPETRGGDY